MFVHATVARRPSAALGLALAALACGVAAETPSAYRIGEPHPVRQVNLCETEAEATELAGIFRKYGVRPGFSALSNAPACARRVVELTPLRVLDEVVVSPDTAEEYRVSFVLVRVGNTESVLVTTRAVIAP